MGWQGMRQYSCLPVCVSAQYAYPPRYSYHPSIHIRPELIPTQYSQQPSIHTSPVFVCAQHSYLQVFMPPSHGQPASIPA